LDEKEGIIFTYRLLDGVAEEKLGMWLLRKERVFEILREFDLGIQKE